MVAIYILSYIVIKFVIEVLQNLIVLVIFYFLVSNSKNVFFDPITCIRCSFTFIKFKGYDN